MLKSKLIALSAALLGCIACSSAQKPQFQLTTPEEAAVPTVYYIKDITPENLVKMYEALGREAEGNVAVKISTGESSKSNHLAPELIAPLVKRVNGTLVECNTAYNGNRGTNENHRKAVAERGYDKIAKVDIMDAEGDTILPLNLDGEHHIPYDLVGKSFYDYDFLVVLSHFKGHQMGGLGGALKNISIGIASADGKALIHSAGRAFTVEDKNIFKTEQNAFLESMAEASKAVSDHFGDKVIYINVANNLSVDCDCNGNPDKPRMADLGIFASLDPVAVDAACVDFVHASPDEGKEYLIERIKSRNGVHTLVHAEKLGVGSMKYKLKIVK